MKLKYWGLIFLLSWANIGLGQDVSRLIAQVGQARTDAERIPLYLQIARTYRNAQQYELAVDYYFKALAKQNEPKNLAITYEELGMLYQKWNAYDKSIEYFRKSYDFYQRIQDTKGQISTLQNIAWASYQTGLYPEAINSYGKVADIYKKQKANNEALAEIYNKISVLSELNNQYPQAIEYSTQSLSIYQKNGNQDGLSKTLNNLGVLYRKTGDNRKSLQSFNQAIALNLQKLGEAKTEEQKAVIFNNIGVIYTNSRSYNEALGYYEDALKIREKLGKAPATADALNRIAANYYLSGNSEKALAFLPRAIDLAKNSNAKAQLMDSYRIYSDIYKGEGNIQEYEKYNKLFNEAQGELDAETNRKAQDILNKKLLIEQLESKLKISSAEDERARAELENQKLLAENLTKEKEIERQRAIQAEKEKELERARAIQAEKEREIARAQAETAEKDKELEQARAEQAEKGKELAIANEDKAKAEAKQAKQARQLAEAEAKQTKQEKLQLETEQKRRNQFYLFSLILGFGSLITFFILYSYIRNRQKNKLLREQNTKIQEQNTDLAQKNEEIAAQRDHLAELNEEVNQQKEEIESQRDVLALEREKSDKLLLNILPQATAQELKEKGYATPQSYEKVTVLFTDFRGFTQIASQMHPEQVVRELDHCFLAFDEIIEKYNLEKIKTIGDAYMCAGGVPIANDSNPIDAVRAGLEIQAFMEEFKKEKLDKGEESWEVRLGIHTGPLVAGVVGRKKFAYDIWGDAVNLASRMESSGEVGKVNISGDTYELIKEYFDCTYRGKIPAKNKGDVDMYFVNAEKTVLEVVNEKV